MVDRPLLARKIAAVRDAIERIATVLPVELDIFLSDRTRREVVVLNLFRQAYPQAPLLPP